jgi:hypothetical protein
MRTGVIYIGIGLLIIGLIVGIVVGGSESEEGCVIDPTMGAPAALALTETHVEGIVTSMKVMALTDEVKSADWDTMEPLLEELEDNSIPLTAWFVLPDGSYYTVDSGEQSGNLSGREYFPVVMGGDVAVGYTVVSKSTGKNVMVAAVPVQDGNDVIGALGTSIYLDDLSQMIVDDLKLWSDMVFYAVNEDDVIALHSDSEMIMQDASEQADLPCFISYTSGYLGWTFAIGYDCTQ